MVVAGNVDASDEVAALLGAAGTPYVLADNVVPRIGVLAPESARAAIREMFLRHVIGGKHLSKRADFTGRCVELSGATPDVVLTAVELLARGLDAEHPGAGDVVVVDVGGATTDVHSVVEVDAEEAGLEREVVATLPVSRTVEGDLGMRWSAVPTVEEGLAAGVVAEAERLRAAAAHAPRRPGVPPGSDAGRARRGADRHRGGRRRASPPRRSQPGRVRRARPGPRAQRQGPARGRPARRLGRRAPQQPAGDGRSGARGGDRGRRAGGWQLPRAPRVVVDHDYVLAAAGLLATEHPRAAHALLGAARRHSLGPMSVGSKVSQGLSDGLSKLRRNQQRRSDERFAERFAGQWASMRAERRAEQAAQPVAVEPGESNFAPGRVPYGVDLAAAWAWRFLVIIAAVYVVAQGIALFAVVVLPLVIALLLTALVVPLVDLLGRARVPRGVASLIVVLGTIGVVALLLTFAGAQIVAGRQRPLQPGRQGTRADQGLAEDGAAARQRQPDQRLHQVGAGGRHLVEQRDRQPG